MKINIRQQVWGVALLLVLASFPAMAGDINNLPDVLTENLGLIANVMQSVSIVLGLGLFVGGMFHLKRYGEMRTMMSAQMTIWGPLMRILSGAALMYLPVMISTSLVAFWGTGGDMPIASSTSMEGWAQYIPAVLMLVRLVGVYAFMRAFMLAARSGRTQGQPGTVGKVLVNLLAGILCVHVMGTIQLIESILGFSFSI